MRVLLGCEESGIVREEFIKLGHDAWSCDILPSRIPGNHYQCDIKEVINDKWDMMIAFPPCTYLTVSANKWYKDQPKRKSGVLVGKERRQARKESIEFFMFLVNSKIQLKGIENPIGIMSTEYRKPDQIIQPWQFGHGETKATCLWLQGLPKLLSTNIVEGREARIHKMTPSQFRQRERSVTYLGIAQAMANQWGTI